MGGFMNNNHITKILFCATIAVICLGGCGGDKSTQKRETNVETLDVIVDSLNPIDSSPAVSRDSRLVNNDNEAWVRWTGGSHKWSFCGMVFHTNGNFSIISAGGIIDDLDNWVEEPQNVDNWDVKTTSTWYTEENKIIKVFINERTTAIPYTIKTLNLSNGKIEENLVFDVDDLMDDLGNINDLGDYDFYFGFDYYKTNIR
jgi:hypothetical protein